MGKTKPQAGGKPPRGGARGGGKGRAEKSGKGSNGGVKKSGAKGRTLKGKMATKSCDTCRHKRVKCDEGRPCDTCQSKGIVCTYHDPEHKRGPKAGWSRMRAAMQIVMERYPSFADALVSTFYTLTMPGSKKTIMEHVKHVTDRNDIGARAAATTFGRFGQEHLSASHPETVAMLSNPQTVAARNTLLRFLQAEMSGGMPEPEDTSSIEDASASSSSSDRLADPHPASPSQSQGEPSDGSAQGHSIASGAAHSSTVSSASQVTRVRPFAPTSQSSQPAFYSQARRIREGRATAVETTQQVTSGGESGLPIQDRQFDSAVKADQTQGSVAVEADVSSESGWTRGTEQYPNGSFTSDLHLTDPYLMQQPVPIHYQDDSSLMLPEHAGIPQESAVLLPTNQQGDQLGIVTHQSQLFHPVDQQAFQQAHVSNQDAWMHSHQQPTSMMAPSAMPSAISEPASALSIPGFQPLQQTLPRPHDQTQSNPTIHSAWPNGFGQEMLHRVPFHLQSQIPQELIDQISQQAAVIGITPTEPAQQSFLSDDSNAAAEASLYTGGSQFQTTVPMPGAFTTMTFAPAPALAFAGVSGASEMDAHFGVNIPQAVMDHSMSGGQMDQQWFGDQVFSMSQGHHGVQSDGNFMTCPPAENNNHNNFHNNDVNNW